MAKLTDDSNNQTYTYHQLTMHNSHNETSVIVNNNSSFQNYTNPDDHTQQVVILFLKIYTMRYKYNFCSVKVQIGVPQSEMLYRKTLGMVLFCFSIYGT